MTDFVECLQIWAGTRNYRTRTVIPGLVDDFEDGTRERLVDFESGPASLTAGEAEADGITPELPAMTLAGGGFFCCLPTTQGDEMLGLVSDRSLSEWRQTRTPGSADPINGKRSKVLSDMMLLPFTITAPAGAPNTWDHLVLGGPNGAAIEVNTDGSIVITKAGGVVATLTMETSGSVTIDVQPGQSVNLGGASAVALAKWQQLEAAIDALLTAGSGAGTGAPGTTGKLAFDAATVAWNLAKGAVPTTKAKGE